MSAYYDNGDLIQKLLINIILSLYAGLVYMIILIDCVGGGDKDARDLREMEMERRLREGRDTGTWTGVAGFEKHTKV